MGRGAGAVDWPRAGPAVRTDVRIADHRRFMNVVLSHEIAGPGTALTTRFIGRVLLPGKYRHSDDAFCAKKSGRAIRNRNERATFAKESPTATRRAAARQSGQSGRG